MSWTCPVCQTTLTKLSLDRYFCPGCDQDWLLHKLRKSSRRYSIMDNYDRPDLVKKNEN